MAVAVPDQGGNPDAGDDFVVRHCGGKGSLEEVGDGDGAGTVGALHLHAALHHRDDGAPVGGGVGVGEVATDGAPVPHLRVADAPGHLGHQGVGVPHVVGTGNLAVGRQRADLDMVVVDGNSLEVVQPANVNQVGGTGQPQPHQGQQAVSAGQQPGIFVVAEHLDSFGHRAGLVVAKFRRVHFAVPPRPGQTPRSAPTNVRGWAPTRGAPTF